MFKENLMKLNTMIAVSLMMSLPAFGADDKKPIPAPNEGKMTITGTGNVRAKANLGGLAVNIVMKCFQDREEAEKKFRAVQNAVNATLAKYKGGNTTEYILSSPTPIDSDQTLSYDDYSNQDRDGVPVKETREIEACRHVSGGTDRITLVTEQVNELQGAKAAVYAAVKDLVSNKKAGKDITDTLYVTVENPSFWITAEGMKTYRNEVLKKALAHHDTQKATVEKQCLVLTRERETFDASEPDIAEPPYFAKVAPVTNTIELGGGDRPSGVTAYPVSAAGTELVAQYTATYKIFTADFCSK